MKKRLIITQIMQTIFVVLLLTIALLQNKGVIASNNNLSILYYFLPILYSFIIIIFLSIGSSKYKEYGIKIVVIGFSLIAELVLLIIFCLNIDNRVDKIKFRKQCGETEATIYKIEEKKSWDSDHEREEIEYTYYFEYIAMGENNSSSFKDSSRKNIGDKITIYYDKENPKDYRFSIWYAEENFFIVIFTLIVALRTFEIIYLRRVKLDGTNI